jgi:hypothetical protein
MPLVIGIVANELVAQTGVAREIELVSEGRPTHRPPANGDCRQGPRDPTSHPPGEGVGDPDLIIDGAGCWARTAGLTQILVIRTRI